MYIHICVVCSNRDRTHEEIHLARSRDNSRWTIGLPNEPIHIHIYIYIIYNHYFVIRRRSSTLTLTLVYSSIIYIYVFSFTAISTLKSTSERRQGCCVNVNKRNPSPYLFHERTHCIREFSQRLSESSRRIFVTPNVIVTKSMGIKSQVVKR